MAVRLVAAGVLGNVSWTGIATPLKLPSSGIAKET
jgi:hypothetical protein